MRDNYRLGRVSTILVYLLEGIAIIIFTLVLKRHDMTTIVSFSVSWFVGLIILLMLGSGKRNVKMIYLACEVVFTTLVSCWGAEAFANPVVLVMTLFVQWMCNLLFLQKYVFRGLTVVHAGVLTIFSFVVDRLVLWEYICAVLVLLVIWFFSEKLVDIVDKQRQINADHEQSLDDLLGLVEVKFEEARQANHAKSTFLANMSHEIRTPINTVLGLDTMILRECRDPDIRKYALNIHTAGQSLLSIINDILDFSKIESGKMEITPVDYDLSSVINDVTNMIVNKAESKGLRFNVNIDNNIPSRLIGDDVRIRQILVNLLTNAVKYTHKGSVTMTVNGTVEGDIFNMYCSVCDTGIGIREEDKDKLFGEFVRVDEKRNRNIEGTGLGLCIVIQLLRLMGSSLMVDSVYGEGSDFYFTLAQKISSHEPIGDLQKRINEQATDYNYEVAFTIPKADILVVDDNAMNRLVFKELLKGLKCEIDEADSGAACLELVQRKKYDIIFMDHMMPEMDGIETFTAMESMPDNLCADTPVIALTANAVSGAKEMYLAAGFTAFLSKPIVPEKLEKMIYNLLPDSMISEAKTETLADARAEALEQEAEREFPQIEGIDWEYARLHLPGDELIFQTVKSFYQTIDAEADYFSEMYTRIVSDAEDTQAMDLFRIRVHAMKSTATLFGALPVAGTAAMLEYAARDGQRQTVMDVTPGFLELLRTYKQKLKSFVDSSGNARKADSEDAGDIVDYLKQLIETSAEFDVNGADSAVEHLETYEYPEGMQALFDDIRAAVTNLDADRVKILCNEMIKRVKEEL